jgi:T3SS (YopN, CesT) and YbjN peptide-binding chaperone 1/T3SS (YopN, CesT) and YbjN peptide-binding chaperone 3
MADIDDFDIDRSISSAWTEFQSRLSEVISMIDESGDLTIGTASADRAPYVRFSCPAANVIRCEAAGNAALGANFQLTDAQAAAMERLGWQPSGGQPPTGDFWFEAAQEESDRLSQLAVAALRDVYGVQHPIFLAPDQLTEVLQPVPAPIEAAAEDLIVIDRDELAATMPANPEHLAELVDAELAHMYGHPPIRDAEGDVAIRVGSTMIFLRTSADGQEVVIFAAVVHDVAGRSRAAEVINDLNVEARWVKFQLIRDRVFVTLSVQAKPFVRAHLHQAVRIVSDVADGIDDELAAKLHGRTTFNDHDDSH